MFKKKGTKRALTASVLSLIMCMSMLVGSTYAWFTDSISSANNIIKSGNLDIKLEYSEDGESWKKVDETVSIFDESTLWEPGHTETVYFRVTNVGNLALKYEFNLDVFYEKTGTNVYGNSFKLSDYLNYGVVAGDELNDISTREQAVSKAITSLKTNVDITGINGEVMTKSLLPEEMFMTALIIAMPDTVPNEANYMTGTDAPYIQFGLNVVATQFAADSETDSFGTDYDKDAKYPVITFGDLKDSVAEGGMVVVERDMTTSFVN